MSDYDNAGGTVETPTIEELQERLAKAEGKIVEMKKASKETPETVETPETKTVEDTQGFMTRQDYEKEEFFKNNPELTEYKDVINEKVSKGYSLDDAKIILLAQDKTIEARKNTQKSNFTTGVPDFAQTEYKISDLEGMTQSQYNQVIKLQKEGKVTIK